MQTDQTNKRDNEPALSAVSELGGASGSANLVITLDRRSANTIVAALKRYEESLFLGDQGGRLRNADAQYIRESIEDGIKENWPNNRSELRQTEGE